MNCFTVPICTFVLCVHTPPPPLVKNYKIVRFLFEWHPRALFLNIFCIKKKKHTHTIDKSNVDNRGKGFKSYTEISVDSDYVVYHLW